MEKITLVGGGLSGSLLAVYLAKRGFEVNLFERRPDMRNNRISAGRSINLALSLRGINALDRAGLTSEIMKDAIPMTGRMVHPVKGDLHFQPYGTEGQSIYSVSRGRLNIKLLELADEYENIHLWFEHKCVDVDYENRICIFTDSSGNEKEVKADHIIGTDGAFAATRNRLQITDRFNYSQSYLEHGYKELSIPAGEGGKFLMDKNSLHIWPRGNFMMIALPNPAGDFTCTLFFPFEGEKSFSTLKTEEQVSSFFQETFPDAVPMMPTLLEDFFGNPTSSLVTVRCYPWVKDDKIALLGDAAHAIVPFYGQGMNCAFEDCVVMDDCIAAHPGDWNRIFAEYQKSRKPNADAIADLAIQNFAEMRDKVGNEEFLEKKHIEHDLCELYPDLFKSQYEMVTFSHIPYLEAKKQGETNNRILEEIWQNKVDVKNRERIAEIINRNKRKNGI